MGLISGTEDDSFAPRETLTRAQVAVVFTKLSVLVNSIDKEEEVAELPSEAVEELEKPEEPEEVETACTITFDANGGSSIAPVTVLKGKTVAKPQTPARNDYSFLGWYSDKDLKNAYDFKTPVEENLTLYAKWAFNSESDDTKTYIITYEANDGSGREYTAKVNEGSVHTALDLIATGFTRDGYRFDDWYYNTEGMGSHRQPGDLLTVTEDITLYAKWTQL